MNKTFIRVISLTLCGLIILGLAATAFADEAEAGNSIAINNLEEFLSFAENCRLDSNSQGKHYVLNTDIDLTDSGFTGISIFCGSFDGDGHTISGLELTGEGSYLGLFRYLTETATVSNLTVSGTVAPAGTRSYVGGIAGSNAGTLTNCAFVGDVSGADYAGGLVGINQIGGVIEDCSMTGMVHGSHFVGGIAGENKGQIRTSTNAAEINTTVAQNSVDISDITLDNLTGSESAITVTDIGGIAGTSSGFIIDCINQGGVGYQYMGYNIGGIAGSQSGHISGCINYAEVYGRKEVGGIVGQLEPYTTVSFETDTLQILKEQVADLSDMTKRASASAKDHFDNIGSLIAKLENHISDIEDATEQLTPDEENPQLNDLETTIALLEKIGNSIAGINETVDSLYTAIKDTTTTLNSDLESIAEQVDVISSTLDNASDNLGGSALDVSDNDTEDDKDSKVEECQNFGAVLGDLNAGGIVGAIAVENDLDPESDVSILGDTTLNYAVDVRSVILSCANSGSVQVRKQRAGGIVGWMSMGLVKNCISTGSVDAETADYVGGIVGSSMGYVRSCSAKCRISGDAYVGGIAGEADILSNCRSMIVLETGTEKLGGIIGFTQERDEITGNYYLPVEGDFGGIDGVGYAGSAQALSREEFLSLSDLNEIFRTVSLYFIFEDGTQQMITADVGGTVAQSAVPPVPEKDGYVGSWEGLEEEDLVDVSFDAVYTASYTSVGTVIESDLVSDGGLPILLAQGEFHPGDTVNLEALKDMQCVEAWKFSFPEGDWATSIRCLLPDGYVSEDLMVSVRNAFGEWREADFQISGSYLVLDVKDGDDAICLTEKPEDHTLWIVIGVGVVSAIVIVAAVLLVKKLVKTKRK